MESSALLRLAVPMALTNLCGYCIAQVTVIFVGRLGAVELSAAILATSLFNVTGLSVLTGFSAAMETLAGQAYGAKSYRAVGVVLQRALIIVTLLTALLATVWSKAESLLLLAGQDEEIAAMAAHYILRMIPALYCVGLSEAFKRYLMAQRCVRPVAAVTILALLVAPFFNWLFVFRLGLGFDGAAYAVDAVQAFMAACLGGFIVMRDYRRAGTPTATWCGWSADAFRRWPQYFKFAVPSVVMVCVEWWTFECLILMAGWLPDPQVTLAAAGIGINTTGMVFMLYSGLSQALSIRVSNSLGAGAPKVARRATWTAECLNLILSTVVAVALWLGSHQWPRLFTNIPSVVAATATLMPIFALTLPGDGTNCTLQGLLRGAGAQKLGAISNISSFWCFGIPLAYYLAFPKGLGIQGLWWGLFAVNTLVGSVMLTIALTFNFERAAEKAVARFAVATSEVQQSLLEEADAPANGP
ncbi:hypothetical protein CHLNCDRAFT_54230 [Chlorella variabilis]|uniref:Protein DETOXIFICATION n=1 Tax=Chlorella variabilis TaxID=554065 RepID=E1ZN30_CHLVA|nr:hypothetical protein CHLNCDRAFT_54230 [Chlorella variabilis]EFN52900.1 hypothetical protein CHLNCDRAFT_54230 [Chlorella variabilis]|eukprot:XP_005845002.1 hypothetical protein CHLNCDRAFT_54230 [Chlorella variabilis]